MRRFAAIGECMMELSHRQARQLALNYGGDTYNVAVYMARYKSFINTDIHYVTAIGHDRYSEQMLQQLQSEAIETDLIVKHPERHLGLYIIHNDDNGERTFVYYRDQSAARQLFYTETIDDIINELLAFDYLYFSSISLAILDQESLAKLYVLLQQAKHHGAKIIFDNNYRPKLWPSPQVARETINHFLSVVDIALPTFSDEALLYGDKDIEACGRRLQAAKIPEIVIKNGKDPCLVIADQNWQQVSLQPVAHVVDTTAAGDSFSAGYLVARLQGHSPTESVEFAHRLAAAVIGQQGAIIDKAFMPSYSRLTRE